MSLELSGGEHSQRGRGPRSLVPVSCAADLPLPRGEFAPQALRRVRPREGQRVGGNEELPLLVPPPHFPTGPAGEALWARGHNGPRTTPWLPEVQRGGNFLTVTATFSPFVRLRGTQDFL